MKVSTVSCCPCSWPYFLTLSYISGRQDHNMEETVKPASLSLKSVNQSLCPSQGPPVSISSPSDTSESVKSPNMSTDSGFEGENNRPSLLQTTLPSPSKDVILSSWRSKMYSDGTTALNFDGSDSTSPKSPKKSTDDSDFNESPFDKKSVPSVGDGHSESDNECGSEHNCTFFSSDASWVKSSNHLSTSICDDKKLDSYKEQISAFSICLSRSSDDPDDKSGNKKGRSHVEFGECLTCHKVHYIHCRNCVDCTHCSQDMKWCGTLSSIRECKDHVIYAEGQVNSENEYDIHCKPDTETDTSDDKIFEGNYSDNETCSAYYVPSNVSVTADDYQLTVKLPDEKKLPISEADESSSEEERDSPCLCHIGMCKSERCYNERSKYTTVLKPKAVRPPVNRSRMDYHSSLESLHSQHVVAVIGQHHDRLSAFHERPSSSLSQNEGMHYFFSRSLDMPPSESLARHTTSQLSVVTASNFPTSNSCLFSEATGHRSSLTDMSTVKRCDKSCKKHSAELDNSVLNSREAGNRSSHHSSFSSEVGSPKTRTKRFSMPCDINKNEACHSQFSHYDPNSEPIHMTLEEVHTSLQTLNLHEKRAVYARSSKSVPSNESKSSLGFLGSYLRQKKCKRDDKVVSQSKSDSEHKSQRKSFPVIIKSAFNNFFGLKKNLALPISKSDDELPSSTSSSSNKKSSPNTSPFTNRALPPLPVNGISEWDGAEDEEQWTLGGSQSQIYERESEEDFVRRKMDYAASIERVKDCGWYWGPISGETAEKLLAGEPDGSFVVRDSSDEHYIFSLTFKLNGLVRHVRIEHDHGNFSFGCLQKFRSNTIVDFIDSAVAHSRSGRYLFFLHRRPILGPMRVQLLHPVSRFKQVQSLQHMCRFIILKTLRRDLIDCLPLPRRLKDYLNTPHYYSEELATQSLLTKKCTENNNIHSLSMSSRSSQSGTPPRAENISPSPQSNCG